MSSHIHWQMYLHPEGTGESSCTELSTNGSGDVVLDIGESSQKVTAFISLKQAESLYEQLGAYLSRRKARETRTEAP